MSGRRRKAIKHHLTDEELNEKLSETDDGDIVRRIISVKDLSHGDTVKEAANRIGRSESTGNRWAEKWSKDGLDELAPSYGGGRPPKLDEREKKSLVNVSGTADHGNHTKHSISSTRNST